MEFIAQAKGRYGWGHHPYTQNTAELFEAISQGLRKVVASELILSNFNT